MNTVFTDNFLAVTFATKMLKEYNVKSRKNSQFSRATGLEMLLLSIICSDTTAENSMFPTFKMAARTLYTLPSS